MFKITPRTYYKWLQNLENTGNIVVKVKRTRKRKINDDILKKAVEEKPDSYLRELAKLSTSINRIQASRKRQN